MYIIELFTVDQQALESCGFYLTDFVIVDRSDEAYLIPSSQEAHDIANAFCQNNHYMFAIRKVA